MSRPDAKLAALGEQIDFALAHVAKAPEDAMLALARIMTTAEAERRLFILRRIELFIEAKTRKARQVERTC